jgi:L-ascorbate metabolism protein UlaG (beta-lactamase superfamily)
MMRRMTDDFGRMLAAARPQPGELLIFALGQSSFVLRGSDALVLIDPWLSTALEDEEGFTRVVAPPLRPEEVQAADLVCITHEHPDHFDPPTVAAIAAQLPAARFVAPAPAVSLVEGAGVARERIVPIRADETVEVAGVGVTAVAAAHELHPDAHGGYRFWLDEHGDHRALGYLVELDGHRVFHTGDTIWWPGLEQALRRHAPQLALLPINGRDAMREAQGLWGNLTADEAAALAAAANIPDVIPCHYDGVPGNTGEPDAFVAALRERAPQSRAHVLAPGEQLPLAG